VADGSELVLGLRRELVPGALHPSGVRGVSLDPYLDAIARHGEYRRRRDVEEDPSFKQVIPYLCLRDADRVFLMRRTRAGGDPRLHERYSIGIGGHVNPGDGGPLGGLGREWREEIDAAFEPDLEPLGLLNDDTDPVGAVHLGLVYAADAAGRPVAIRETDKLSGSFASLGEVAAVADRLETWSRLLYEFLAQRRSTNRRVR
jgi:predicted NUDIX family phosphoesterase